MAILENSRECRNNLSCVFKKKKAHLWSSPLTNSTDVEFKPNMKTFSVTWWKEKKIPDNFTGIIKKWTPFWHSASKWILRSPAHDMKRKTNYTHCGNILRMHSYVLVQLWSCFNHNNSVILNVATIQLKRGNEGGRGEERIFPLSCHERSSVGFRRHVQQTFLIFLENVTNHQKSEANWTVNNIIPLFERERERERVPLAYSVTLEIRNLSRNFLRASDWEQRWTRVMQLRNCRSSGDLQTAVYHL